jgi:hypothetical protein
VLRPPSRLGNDSEEADSGVLSMGAPSDVAGTPSGNWETPSALAGEPEGSDNHSGLN